MYLNNERSVQFLKQNMYFFYLSVEVSQISYIRTIDSFGNNIWNLETYKKSEKSEKASKISLHSTAGLALSFKRDIP